MTIEEMRAYAKERGLSEKRIVALVAELHPDESGKLGLEESIQACATINYMADTIANTKAALEAVRAMRDKTKNKQQGY